MNNKILDAKEAYTGPRTCPNCGFQFPLGKFIRLYVVSFGLSRWRCPSCAERLTCNYIKLQFYWLIGLIVFGGVFGLLITYADLGVFNIIYAFPFFGFVLLTFYYETFAVDKD